MNTNWCLIVLQNVIIKSNSFQYIIEGGLLSKGLIIGCIFLFTGGWAYNWWGGVGGGGAYKRQVMVCDWPGFEI